METKQWYATKAEWAEAQARDYRQRTFRSSYGSRSRAQMRSAASDYNRQRAMHFEALAAKFKAEGI